MSDKSRNNAGLTQKAFIFNDKGEILILKRTETAVSKPNCWDLPGGGVDFGEDPLEAICREIKEEAGLEVRELEPFDLTSKINSEGEFWVTVAYKAKVKSPEVGLSFEHDDYKWIRPDEFPKYTCGQQEIFEVFGEIMREITPKDSRYVPFTQQRWCCVPACISMIMYRHGIPLVAQEELGWHLGLIVPEESKHLFYNPRVGKEPASGYGTQISKASYHPNVAFKKLGIPLVMIFHPIDKFQNEKEFRDFISDKIKKDADLVASYSNLEFSNGHIQGGHTCVIDRIFLTDGVIRLIDPERNQPKWQTHKISKLFRAMQKHGPAKMGGLWEFVSDL